MGYTKRELRSRLVAARAETEQAWRVGQGLCTDNLAMYERLQVARGLAHYLLENHTKGCECRWCAMARKVVS